MEHPEGWLPSDLSTFGLVLTLAGLCQCRPSVVLQSKLINDLILVWILLLTVYGRSEAVHVDCGTCGGQRTAL